MEENLLTIFLYYFLRHVALCNTPVHSLPFDMTVGFFFFHIETADEKPFSFVDQSYFFHFFLKRKVGLLRTSQPFPGAGQPASAVTIIGLEVGFASVKTPNLEAKA